MEDERSEAESSAAAAAEAAAKSAASGTNDEENNSDEDYSDFEDAAMVSEDDESFDYGEYTRHGSPMPRRRVHAMVDSPTEYVEYVETKEESNTHQTVVKYLHAGLMATVGAFYSYASGQSP